MKTQSNQQVNRIASFAVDHDKIGVGIYVSRIDGDVTTYDLRTRVPNAGDYLSDVTMHSVEHMFATYIRNSCIGEKVIYFGPMGCRTGFYFLTAGLDDQTVLNIVKDGMTFVRDYEGEIPGTTAVECGNYKEHSLPLAKIDAARYCEDIENITVEDMKYKEYRQMAQYTVETPRFIV